MAEPNVTKEAILKLLGAVMEQQHGPSRSKRERLPQATVSIPELIERMPRDASLDYLTPQFDLRKERIEPMPREQSPAPMPRRRGRELGR
jgi:hypothetical protein